jgi:hypothetical protein
MLQYDLFIKHNICISESNFRRLTRSLRLYRKTQRRIALHFDENRVKLFKLVFELLDI